MQLILSDLNTNDVVVKIAVNKINNKYRAIKKHPTFFREVNQALSKFSKTQENTGFITDTQLDVNYMAWRVEGAK
jgi:5'(3')-deoxyribonucleotidase